MVLTSTFPDARSSTKQRIRAAAAHKKEERLAKGTDEGNSSAPKFVSKALKRKFDGDDVCPSKKTIAILGDASLKGNSSLKPSHGAGKGVMTSSSPVLEGPGCLLTHNEYAIREVGSFVKSTDLEPCDLVGTKDLGVSALFGINKVCLLFLDQLGFISFLLD